MTCEEEWDANKMASEFDMSQCPVCLPTDDYDYGVIPRHRNLPSD